MTDSKQLPAVIAAENYLNELAMDSDKATKVGDLFLKAGLFSVTDKEDKAGITPEVKSARAGVKIMFGASMGLTPAESMKGLHIIKDKVMPSYQVMLTKVRRYGYDYVWYVRTKEVAELEILGYREKDGTRKSLGRGSFSTEDMQRAMLGGDNWKKWPIQMRVSKIVSELVNTCCPEIFGGPVYTPEDFDVCVDGDSEDVLSVEVEQPKKQDAAASSPAAIQKTATATKTTQTQKPATQATPATTATADPKSSSQTSGGDTKGQPAATTGAGATADPKSAAVDGASSAQAEPIDVEISTPATIDEAFQVGRPDWEESYASVVEAGEANGWTEAQVEAWFTQYLVDNGVDCSSLEAVQASWSFEHIEGAVTFVANSEPRDPAAAVEGEG